MDNTQMANICWWYYISKFTEFFDTLFFILRNKMEHVSTLHVIHHGCMPFSVWMGLKFAPGKHCTSHCMRVGSLGELFGVWLADKNPGMWVA